MPVIAVRIPQIGEGLQEARLVAVLKQPGDKVKRDEPIYQMETDKAVMDVESPYEGVLTEWLAPVDTILPIGGEVARMEVADGVEEAAPAHGDSGSQGMRTETQGSQSSSGALGSAGPSARGVQGIPPRTRAYAKEKGIADDVLGTIPATGSKLMPADIDVFLSGGGTGVGSTPASGAGYKETAVTGKQRVLNSRMVRGNALIVPGTITCAISWDGIENVRARVKAKGGEFQPSSFTMFSYCVAQALKDFAVFRTTIPSDETYRTYDHANMGIAVALPGDELVTAVVDSCDTLAWQDFAQRMREKIDLARGGRDQANESVTLHLTNMQNFGLRDAVPVLVPPAMAVLFIGEVYNALDPESSEIKMRRQCNLALTFDHRVVNGVGAANFLKAIKDKVETIGSLITV